MLSPDLVDILACPGCKGNLKQLDDVSITCSACEVEFRIVDGIPVMLIDQALPLYASIYSDPDDLASRGQKVDNR